MELYKVNNDLTYTRSPYVEKNVFLSATPEDAPLPKYEESKNKLPKPIWEGHDDAIKCYDYAWTVAFGNLRQPTPGTGFVSNFIDTAFNGFLFMWDSSFIVMFGKYASQIFDFQKTLDNFYSHQHRDGFICREICESINGEHFSRNDPSSTGPNIMPWSEWESYLLTGNRDRLAKVFDPLLAYHLWLKENRTWRNGTYWSTGWGCGMDNQPRLPEGCNVNFSNGHMIWLDTCIQQVLSAKIILAMAQELGRHDDALSELSDEVEYLSKFINEELWCGEDSYYYDMYRDGSLNHVKSIGAYWILLAGILPENRLKPFIEHLKNPAEFNRPNRVPTLSADSPLYDKTGGYWRGSVWAPTNYMVLKGLEKYGYNDLAYDIAETALNNVVKTYNKTGTLWENYSPEEASRGSSSGGSFVGWSGLFPISIMFEYVFGIRSIAAEDKIVWYVNRMEKHGILQYPFKNASVDLLCASRASLDDEPEITVTSTLPVTVEVHWGNKVKTIKTK